MSISNTAPCPVCKRAVAVDGTGVLRMHGPGKNGAFVCLGTGTKAEAVAAKGGAV